MTRELPEWIGKTDDDPIPPRVKVRVFDKFGGKCGNCTRTIFGNLKAAYDHTIALINDGQNRETNLQLLCAPCHAGKTKSDVALKSTTYRKRAKHLGIELRKGPKIQSRGFQRSKPQRTASRPIERRT